MSEVTQITQNGSNDASVGSAAWSNPTNIETDDTNYALGYSTPGGFGAIAFKEVKIVKADGSIGSDEQASGETATGTPTDYNFGGATELWDESWTAENINDVDFGTVVRVAQGGDSGGNYLKAQDFGFAIPTGATIDGIEVTVNAKDVNEGGGYHSMAVYYIKITIYYTEAPAAPTVTTSAATSVTGMTAQGNGEITDVGAENADLRGFVYGTTTQSDPEDTAPAASAYDSYTTESGDFSAETFNAAISSLEAETTYYIRAWAHNSEGYSYGNELNFTTTDPWFNRPVENVDDVAGTPENLTTVYAEDVLNLQERTTALEEAGGDTGPIFLKLNSTDTTTNVNPSSPVAIEWDTETLDEGGAVLTHETVTNPERVTVEEDGYYRGFINVSFYSTVQRASPQVRVRINGSTFLSEEARNTYIRSASGSNNSSANFEFICELEANDYIEITSQDGGEEGTVVMDGATLHIEKYQ